MELHYYGALDVIGTVLHDTQAMAMSKDCKELILGPKPGLYACTKKYLNMGESWTGDKSVEDARAAMVLLQLWLPGVCGGRMPLSKLRRYWLMGMG